MKSFLLAAVGLIALGTVASAQYVQPNNGGLYGTGSNPNGVYHQGYTTQQGTYVQPHMQSAPNDTQFDNYGTRGNTNPYTGVPGTRVPHW